MKILIATAGSHGDVLPFVALGREFQARGHHVVMYANPYFRHYATDAGLDFVAVGAEQDYLNVLAQLTEGDPRRAMKRVAHHLALACPHYYQAMQADVLPGQTIALTHTIQFAPRLLQETHGVPCATLHLAPTVVRSHLRPARLRPKGMNASTPMWRKRLFWWLLDHLFYQPHFTAPLNRLRRELGLVPLRHIFRSWVHASDCVVGLFPEWFAEPAADWPQSLHLTDFPLYDHGAQAPMSPALLDFLAAGPAPVLFSAGTATATAHAFFQESAQACALAGVRGILVSPFAQQLPQNLPAQVMAVNYAPFGALLPQLAAFVHHGGIGATSQALRAGVPQVIRPVAYDQFDNSERVVRLGVGCEILPEHYTAPHVAATLTALSQDPSWRQRAQAVAARFAKSETGRTGVQAACDVILQHLAPAPSFAVPSSST